MGVKNAEAGYGWCLVGASLWTIICLAGRIDGFAPPPRTHQAEPRLNFVAPQDALAAQSFHQKLAYSTSIVSRKMSMSTDAETAVETEESTVNGANGSSTATINMKNVFKIRRTTAMVLSIAVQRVVEDSFQSGWKGLTWIENGFYCDFVLPQEALLEDSDEEVNGDDKKKEKNAALKARIKEEMDSIIASKTPIVMDSVSIEEAKAMAGDNEVLLQRLEESMADKKDSDTVLICRIGKDWSYFSCIDHQTNVDTNVVLENTGELDPTAIALTSIAYPSKHLENQQEKNGDDLRLQRIKATAFETQSELTAYKTKVDESQTVVKTFGQLVNWGSGNLDGLDYICPCCDPTEDNEGFGLNGLGLLPADPTGQVGPGRAQTRLTVASGPKIETIDRPSSKLATPFVPAKNPEWLAKRESIYDTIKERREAELAMKPTEPIEVTLPDGTVLGADHNLTSWKSSPLDVARCISDGLANVAVVARVRHTSRIGSADAVVSGDGIDYDDEYSGDGKAELWDLTRPLEGNCDIEILTWNSDDEAAQAVFWHSSAHILGQSLEHNYGALLTIGPPVAGGFYYDCYMGEGEGITEKMFGEIEDEFRKSVKRKEKFERLVVTKEEALELFQYSPFKTALIQTKVPDNSRTTVYRNGDLIDLCMGPHVPHTGKIKAFKILRSSAASWLGDADNDQLQRVYGVSFPTKKLLKAHLENLEQAKQRDHRRLGVEQKLFMFHNLSPGSAFFLPKGTLIYNTLSEFIRTQYRERGYSEVITPNVFNLKLWEQSGHAQHYKDDMFTFEVEGEEWGMKPMNCPAHCLMFASMPRSYRELPYRIADFGVLHRNEASGALTGLTRVRRFQQDDAHIFCREDQIEQEVINALEFMKFVYGVFGMTYKLELSTKPKKALGKKELWDRAETALASAMNQFAGEGNWRENPGDGAFYGPKIDIKVMDAMDRVHQCATIQLDFQLPIRFDLRYRKKGGANGDVNGDVNGSANGEVNGSANGDVNGNANGVVNGSANSDVNGKANDAVNGGANGSADNKEAATASVEESQDDSNELPPDFARPVMVHRAMLGSVERMFAVLLEHYGGKWPFWLSPRQALVVPVGKNFVPYANKVVDRLHAAGFHVDIDDSSNSLKKKVREGQLAQYNYILVVGEKEETNDSVAIRNRNNEMEGEKKIDEVIEEFTNLRDTYK